MGPGPGGAAVLDVRPGRRPLRVRDAGVAPVVAAVGQRRLPVGDALEVARIGDVVVGAVVRDFLVEDRARLRVGRRRPERVGRLGLHRRRGGVRHPLQHAVGMGGLRRQHPRVGPAGRPLLREHHAHVLLVGDERVVLIRPRRADHDRAVLEVGDLGRVAAPVVADLLALLLQQVDRGVELVLGQLIRIRDLEVGLSRLQVDGRVGDVDRAVVGVDLAGVARAVEDDAPAVGRRRDDVLVVHEDVRAPLVGDAVVHAVDRVVRRRLERRRDLLEVGDELLDVDGLHVAGGDQAVGGVARG